MVFYLLIGRHDEIMPRKSPRFDVVHVANNESVAGIAGSKLWLQAIWSIAHNR